MYRTPDCFSVAESSRRLPDTPAATRLSAYEVCAGHTLRTELVASETGLFWLEEAPGEQGKVLKFRTETGEQGSLLEGHTLGSRINGYGGGSLAALDDRVVAVTDEQADRKSVV